MSTNQTMRCHHGFLRRRCSTVGQIHKWQAQDQMHMIRRSRLRAVPLNRNLAVGKPKIKVKKRQQSNKQKVNDEFK